MSPVVQVMELCRAMRGNFREELEAHLLHGCVISRADLFLMARPVPHGVEITDPWTTWSREQCDAWFVWSGIGSAAALLALAPYELPWIGWFRQCRGWKKCHWVETKKLKQRIESALVLA